MTKLTKAQLIEACRAKDDEKRKLAELCDELYDRIQTLEGEVYQTRGMAVAA